MPEAALQASVPTPLTTLTDDEVLFRDNIRQFADEKVRPLVKEMDEKGVFEQDLIHAVLSARTDGHRDSRAIRRRRRNLLRGDSGGRRMSRVDLRPASWSTCRTRSSTTPCCAGATEEQKKHYLPRMATDTVGAYALSEAASGSDAFALQTRAELKGGEYMLNGQKLGSPTPRRPDSYSLRHLDPSRDTRASPLSDRKDFPGFSVGKKEDKLGIRASVHLRTDAGRLPRAQRNVLGEVGKGYKIAIETLNEGRIGIGAQMLGLARGAWDYAASTPQERKQFGKAIAEFQAIQFQIAQMATEIEAARLLVYNCARMKDAGMNFLKEAAMTKLFSSQVAERVASLAIEIYGGYGFTKDYPVEKYYRDCQDRQDLRGHIEYAAGDDRQAGPCQVRSRDRLAALRNPSSTE